MVLPFVRNLKLLETGLAIRTEMPHGHFLGPLLLALLETRNQGDRAVVTLSIFCLKMYRNLSLKCHDI